MKNEIKGKKNIINNECENKGDERSIHEKYNECSSNYF